MNTIIAVGNIAGSLVASMIIGIGLFVLMHKWNEQNIKSLLEDASISLGIPKKDVDNGEHNAEIIKFLGDRFGSDRFANRISDLFGLIQAAFNWLALIAQIIIWGGAIWYSFSDNPSDSINAWWAIFVSIASIVLSIVFSLLCKFVTGRYPGQAWQVRKNLIKYIENSAQ